jgi:hypothetical protein
MGQVFIKEKKALKLKEGDLFLSKVKKKEPQRG